MVEEILDFIFRRFKGYSDWLDGNCLWFAYILKKRFSQLEIYYLPIEGHFVCGLLHDNKTIFFDWRGAIIVEEEPILFDSIKEDDPAWYQRLIRDCFL